MFCKRYNVGVGTFEVVKDLSKLFIFVIRTYSIDVVVVQARGLAWFQAGDCFPNEFIVGA